MLSAPTLALTATATKRVREEVCTSLHMRNVAHVTGKLDRPNITYSTYKVDESYQCLDWLIEMLNDNPANMPKTIIYCRKIDNITNIRRHIIAKCSREALYTAKVGIKYCRVVAFHASIADQLKEHITTSFPKEDSPHKIIIASIAFGLGIDGLVRYVIHYGAPRDFSSYTQESGRAGKPSMN